MPSDEPHEAATPATPHDAVTIRPLTRDDASAYHALRLEGLRDSPRAFGSSPEEAERRTLEATASRIAPGPDQVVLGAFRGGHLVGTVGLYRLEYAKERHKALLWGMYVTPSARGRGLADALVRRLLEHASGMPGVRQVNLAVAADNVPALRLYESFGFEAFGHERHALVVDGEPVDEVHMVRVLPGSA